MKLENQVCTLEQAKKFDEFGLKLESYFVWSEQYGNEEAEYAIWMRSPLESILQKRTDYKRYSAYSSAELDVLLPYRCEIDGNKFCYYDFRKGASL